MRFLVDLDTTLRITDQSVRVMQLRDLIADTKTAVENAGAPTADKKTGEKRPKLSERIMGDDTPPRLVEGPKPAETPKAVETTALVEKPKLQRVAKRAIAAPPLRPMPILDKPQTP
jgi:hypothetical protein